MEDTAILDALCRADPAGMEALRRRYGGLLHYVVRGILSDPRDMEECLADVLLRVWQEAGRYDPARGSLAAWLTAIARNQAVSRLRADRRHSGHLPLEENQPGGESPEDTLLRQEEIDQLRAALARLSGSERALFYRKYYYLQSTERMARELGRTARAVEGRLYRLRQKLRKALGGDWA